MIKKLLCTLLFSSAAYAQVCTMPSGERWQDYSPAVGSTKKAALLVRKDTRQWSSEWIGFGNGDTQWRDPNTGQSFGVEHWRLINGWWKILGFDQWSADCTKADFTDLTTGVVTPLACDGKSGHWYTPDDIPVHPYRIRNWGLIAGTNRFYWEARFYPGSTMSNPCYYTGNMTLPVIREQENWWDDSGWLDHLSHPVPFNGKTPIEVNVPMTREVTIAKGYGVWTLHDLEAANPIDMCLYSVWTWGQ